MKKLVFITAALFLVCGNIFAQVDDVIIPVKDLSERWMRGFDFEKPVNWTTTLQDSNLILIGRLPDGCSIASFVVGNYANIGNGGAVDILDISNPGSPLRTGRVVTPGVVQDIHVCGNYAYVANRFNGLRIIDVSNPFNPTQVGFLNTGGYAWAVSISGDHVYLSDGYDGLRIIDVGTPSNPIVVGFFDIGDWAEDIYSSGNLVYVADATDGLYILQNDLISGMNEDEEKVPQRFSLEQSFPNPFNPSTNIRYYLPVTSEVVLKIYNSLGQEVRTLVEKVQTAGKHEVIWDGKDNSAQVSAAGLYIRTANE